VIGDSFEGCLRYVTIATRALSDLREFYGSLRLENAEESDKCLTLLPPPEVRKKLLKKLNKGVFVRGDLYTFGQHCMKGRGFDIQFIPWRNTKLGIDLGDYVSWLLLVRHGTEEQPGLFRVIFDDTRIRDSCEHLRGRQKTLSKVFLHELGHAVLHSARYLQAEPGKPVEADQTEENEAYVFALFLWGILVGDYGEWCRRTSGFGDKAWVLA